MSNSSSISPHDEPSQRPARRSSITFGDTVNVVIVPRIEDSMVRELFYQDHEVLVMRCEANMQKVGLDPENFDWRSMR